MGRPLNKRNFGDPATKDGNQLAVMATVDGTATPVPAWIVRQKTNNRYIVTDGTNTVLCELVEEITGPAQFTILAENELSATFPVKSLHAHRAKTFDVQNKAWSYEPATADRFKITGN